MRGVDGWRRRAVASLIPIATALSGLHATAAMPATERVRVSFTAPNVAEARLSAPTTLRGTATPSRGARLRQVVLLVDSGTYRTATGTSSWSVALDPAAYRSGAHVLTAMATDSRGRRAGASMSVTFAATPAQRGFVTRQGPTLLLDGAPFHFTGLNLYSAYADAHLDAALTTIGSGQEVFRAFFYQHMAMVDGKRSWDRLDRVLALAKAHGMKVIPVLADQWGASTDGPEKFLPWWPAPYGGDGYRLKKWNSTDLTPYREWVSDVVTRYRDDPTVAFWQLVNEGEARRPDGSFSEATSREAVRAFADDVGGLVKGLDPNHLVSLGTLSGMAGSIETDYGYVHESAPIDIADFHDYGFPTSPMGNTDPYNGLGVSLERIQALGKVLVVGEIGIHWTELDHATLARRAELFEQKLSAQSAAGVAGSLLWCWNDPASRTWDFEIGPGDPALGVIAQH